jgi:hypothetical protein
MRRCEFWKVSYMDTSGSCCESYVVMLRLGFFRLRLVKSQAKAAAFHLTASYSLPFKIYTDIYSTYTNVLVHLAWAWKKKWYGPRQYGTACHPSPLSWRSVVMVILPTSTAQETRRRLLGLFFVSFVVWWCHGVHSPPVSSLSLCPATTELWHVDVGGFDMSRDGDGVLKHCCDMVIMNLSSFLTIVIDCSLI